jgi:hypothetical protein
MPPTLPAGVPLTCAPLGGTVDLSHEGDLDFGEIATNHEYTRRIIVRNLGNVRVCERAAFPHTLTAIIQVPCDLFFAWTVPGRADALSYKTTVELHPPDRPNAKRLWAMVRGRLPKILAVGHRERPSAREHW